MSLVVRWIRATAAIAAVALLFGPDRAEAGLRLRITATSGTGMNATSNSITLPANGNGANGVSQTYSGTLSSSSDPSNSSATQFAITLATGSSNSPNGLNGFGRPTYMASLFNNQMSIESNGAGTLTIEVTDDNFAVPGPSAGNVLKSRVTTNANSTDNYSYTFQSFADANNTDDFSRNGTTTGVQGSFTPTNLANKNTVITGFNRSTPTFSLLSVATFTFSDAGLAGVSSETDVIAPEPSTLVMMAAGLPVVGLIGWRRRRVRAKVAD